MADYLALPDEVVAETILWRLPVKSIMQCRCVSKSWNSLITSSNFISTHLLRKTLTQNSQIFLNQKDYIDKTGRCLLLFDNQNYLGSMLFHLPHGLLHPNINIVGSVNGLICYSIGEGRLNRIVKLILCNPSIGRFQSIPQPHSSLVIDWYVKSFGFDERTLDYKILLISSGKIGFIYSLNSNCWKRITCCFPEKLNTLLCGSVVFVNGRFHWLASDPVIMVFDVKSEAFGHISLPKCLENSRMAELGFMEFGESSIAIFRYHEHGSHISIMKEYSSTESWRYLLLATNSRAWVLGFRNKNEVVIRCKSGRIASQKINNNKLEGAKKMTDAYKNGSLGFSLHKYVPSLVLLDKKNNVDVAAPTHTIVDIAAPTRTKRIKSNSQS